MKPEHARMTPDLGDFSVAAGLLRNLLEILSNRVAELQRDQAADFRELMTLIEIGSGFAARFASQMDEAEAHCELVSREAA